MLNQKALAAAVSTVPVYIEDVFSTYLYTGTSATQTITNGVDLSGSGGLVWLKRRNGASYHALSDTTSGITNNLCSNAVGAQNAYTSTVISSATSSGFVLANNGDTNQTAGTYASWTFRKQAKFFDIVTYTGDGTDFRQIAHSLGSTPGFIIVKATSVAHGWACWHRGNGTNEYVVRLNSSGSGYTPASAISGFPVAASSTTFTVRSQVNGWDAVNYSANDSGQTYVAYLFAHDAGGFGTSGSDNVISCGSFTDTTSSAATVTLGWEPQWVLAKKTTSGGANETINDDWYIADNMRGLGADPTTSLLYPNLAATEGSQGFSPIRITSTGFIFNGAIDQTDTFIYIAIRRGPMKTPTSGTSVFSPNAVTSSSGNTTVTAGFPVDLSILKLRDFADGARWIDRLRGITSSTTPEINSTSTSAEFTSTDIINAGQTTVQIGPIGTYSCVNWNFRRAPGFFDVVAYTGNTVAGRTVAHNLGVAPEMMIVKNRNAGVNWMVYHKDLDSTSPQDKYLILNGTNATQDTALIPWNDTVPTSSVFTVSSYAGVNESPSTYIAYLFATVAGVSKVGSYTGNGSSQTINCGFTAGSRFVLIKRTDSTGDWYVWDSARGIIAGNDPHLSLNTTAAEVTTDDSVDTDNSGFIVNQLAATNINVSSATYIFLAIA
jgi:hypothetical protein